MEKFELTIFLLNSQAPFTLPRRNWKKNIFTLTKRHMFSVHTKPEKFEKARITSQLGFVFEENSGREFT